MVNTSKVLTVSYGTFSCTLEGFDDSFDTMKAIAEYFRDLAADDRYFGAEPPTPDADMLARIAEREVSRRVEAHQEGSNFVLRTALPAADIAEADAGVAAQTDAEDESASDAAEAEAAAELAARQQTERRAAKRAAIQATQQAEREAEQAAALDTAKKEAEATQRAEEAQLAADQEAEKLIQQEAERVAEEERVQQAAVAAQAAKDAAAQAEAQAEASALAATAQVQDSRADSEPDSIADKLARIRAVVGQPKPVAAAPDYSEDEHADDIMQGQPGDTDLEDLIDIDAEIPIRSADSDEDTMAGVMSRLAEPTVDSEPSHPVVGDAALPDPDLSEIEESDAQSENPAPSEGPAAPLRARVIKMKRAEFEAALASGDIESVDDDVPTDSGEIAEADAPDTSADESVLSSDEEAELQRELAAVEAELAGLGDAGLDDAEPDGTDYAEDYEDEASATPIPAPTRGIDELPGAPEDTLDRLMVQTSNELDEPDGKQRRNAMGHLRAAVASARADKAASPNAASVDETEAYRGDLESAVRPRRPVRRLSPQDASPEAANTRAPLKLVAEQRVDADDAAPVAPEPATPARVAQSTPQPVRPRRVSAQDRSAQAPATLDPDAGSFAEFAEEMGATELPDLLEAAAAYLAYVEGKDQFSRPQVMTKVRMVQEDNYSREDGLRSFGQLLRQGKIEKISGGRFTVSDRISFKPDTRAAG